MELLTQYADALVMLLVITVSAYLLKERLDRFEARVDARFDQVPTREEMNARFVGVEGRVIGLDGRLDRLERSMDAVRSDITQIALSLGIRARPETG